jgi:hypothetical protein
LWFAVAEASPTVELAGQSECPSPAAVALALHAIFPDLVVGPGGLRIEVSDGGADFTVVAGASTRQLSDGLRRCDERATKAAVFISLVLEPPHVAVAPPQPRRSVRVEVEAGARFNAAPSPAVSTVYAGGAELRLFVGMKYFGALVGIAGESPVLLSPQAQLWRIPVALGFRGRLERGRLVLGLDTQLLLTAQITQSASDANEQRLEPAIRLAALVEFLAHPRIAPFFSLHGELVPRPFNLVLPSGEPVGTTPQYWIGFVTGIAFRVH